MSNSIACASMACASARFGLSAIWWAIALLMVGLLLVALAVPQQALKGADWAESLGDVVRRRRFWILVLVSISINVCWHFLVNWLPTYLKEDRGMTFLASGLLTAVPFLAADAGTGSRLATVSVAEVREIRSKTVASASGACLAMLARDSWVMR